MTDGFPPDETPRFGHIIVEKWHQDALAADEAWRAAQGGARFRHSQAGDCARAIAYAALKVPQTNLMSPSAHFITRQGQNIHDEWQALLSDAFDGDIEVTVHFNETTGHIDGVVTLPVGNRFESDGSISTQSQVVAIEGKTVDGYSFKAALGIPPAARTPLGPKYSHMLQAFLNARALDADEAVIIYWARGAISAQAARRNKLSDLSRVVAEWTYTADQYALHADREIQRVVGILRLLDDEKMLPLRRIPDPELPRHHVITNPRKGEWVEYDNTGKPVDAGTTWHCLYCPWQDVCASTGAQRQSVDVLEQIELPAPRLMLEGDT